MPTAKELAQRLKRHTEVVAAALEIPAVIVDYTQGSNITFRVIDTNGNYIPGQVWCRFFGGDINDVFIASNTAVEARANLPVYVRQSRPGKFEVIRLRSQAALDQLGEGAGSYGAPDKIGELSNFVLTGRNFGPGRLQPVSTTAQLTMSVKPFWYSHHGQRILWPGGTIDLSAYLPSTTDYWAWVQVFIDPDSNTLSATTGTEYALLASLTDAELATIDTRGLIPVDAVRLRESMTQSAGPAGEYFYYGRQSVGVPEWIQAATTTTTDDTETTALSVAVAEAEAVLLKAQVTALRDDYSEMYWATLNAGARRASAGNVTLVGTPTVDSDNDSSGTPAVTADVDTGSQTLRVRVTGESSKNFIWTVHYMLTRA